MAVIIIITALLVLLQLLYIVSVHSRARVKRETGKTFYRNKKKNKIKNDVKRTLRKRSFLVRSPRRRDDIIMTKYYYYYFYYYYCRRSRGSRGRNTLCA